MKYQIITCFLSCSLLSSCMSKPESNESVATASSSNENKIPQVNHVSGKPIQQWLALEAMPFVEGQDIDSAFNSKDLGSKLLWQSAEQGTYHLSKQTYQWQSIDSTHATLDLLQHLALPTRAANEPPWINNSETYLATVLNSDKTQTTMLALGSDDAVKVWLNGELVHQNLAYRGVVPDQDMIPITLQVGENQLLVRVLNAQGGWGLTARTLGKTELQTVFADLAVTQELSLLDKILSMGLDINGKNALGLTVLHMAKIKNQPDLVKALLKRGADATIEKPDIKALVSAYLDSGFDQNKAGMSYLIAKDNEVLVSDGFGYADINNTQKINTDTKFRIASVTKQFTAVAILLLSEQGKLSIDDRLGKYLPDFPKATDVSIRHLLNHTSGIYNYTNDSEFMSDPLKAYSQAEMLTKISNYKYDFKPGEEHRYSNSNYYLLGYIIEKASGLSYAQFLQQAIFEPLAMNDSGIYVNNIKYDNEANGRMLVDANEIAGAPDTHSSQPSAAGNIYSTVNDLFIWNKALHGGQFLSSHSYQALSAPAALLGGKVFNSNGQSYGFGIGLLDYQNEKVLLHGGGIHGFSSMLAGIPSKGVTYITLSNMGGGQFTYKEAPFLQVFDFVLSE